MRLLSTKADEEVIYFIDLKKYIQLIVLYLEYIFLAIVSREFTHIKINSCSINNVYFLYMEEHLFCLESILFQNMIL